MRVEDVEAQVALEARPLALVHVEPTLVQSRGETGYTALGWQVLDLNETVDRLREKGIDFIRYNGMDQDDHDAWQAPDGVRVAWFRDPHGNVLSLLEH